MVHGIAIIGITLPFETKTFNNGVVPVLLFEVAGLSSPLDVVGKSNQGSTKTRFNRLSSAYDA